MGGTNASCGADLAKFKLKLLGSVCTPADTFRFFGDLCSAALTGESKTEGREVDARSPPSSRCLLSAFFFSIHQTAPDASHASVKTECTICAVSNPSMLRVLSSSLSTGVENMIGVGVLNSETKSRSRPDGSGMGVGVLSAVGEAGSDSMDETERRFVRAGVRTGCIGGAFDELEELCRGGEKFPVSS